MKKIMFFELDPTCGTILFWTVSLVLGFYFIKSWQKIKQDETILITTEVILGCVGACITAGSITGFIANNTIETISLISNSIAGLIAGVLIGSAIVIDTIGINLYGFSFASIFTSSSIGTSIGWFIGRGLSNNCWSPLMITIVLLVTGISLAFISKKTKVFSFV
jgi:hypothetical protein